MLSKKTKPVMVDISDSCLVYYRFKILYGYGDGDYWYQAFSESGEVDYYLNVTENRHMSSTFRGIRYNKVKKVPLDFLVNRMENLKEKIRENKDLLFEYKRIIEQKIKHDSVKANEVKRLIEKFHRDGNKKTTSTNSIDTKSITRNPITKKPVKKRKRK